MHDKEGRKTLTCRWRGLSATSKTRDAHPVPCFSQRLQRERKQPGLVRRGVNLRRDSARRPLAGTGLPSQRWAQRCRPLPSPLRLRRRVCRGGRGGGDALPQRLTSLGWRTTDRGAGLGRADAQGDLRGDLIDLTHLEVQRGRIGQQAGQDGESLSRDESGFLLPITRSLEPHRQGIPQAAAQWRVGLSTSERQLHRGTAYDRVPYHQKLP